MRAFGLLAALLLTACAGQQGDWTKEGATPAAMERDSLACERAARVSAEREAFRGAPAPPPQVRVDRGGGGSPDIVQSQPPGSGLGEASARNEFYRKCMQDLGYRQAPRS